LEGHRAILYSHRETDWRFQAAGAGAWVRPTAGLRVNNGMFIRDAALAGLGVALVPSFTVPQELRSGALKALNVGYEPEDADLNIAYPRDRISSAKLLGLTHHLRLAFGSPPYWEIAPGEEPGRKRCTGDSKVDA
jgi:DNA-binding transcriptional LysR family regulator